MKDLIWFKRNPVVYGAIFGGVIGLFIIILDFFSNSTNVPGPVLWLVRDLFGARGDAGMFLLFYAYILLTVIMIFIGVVIGLNYVKKKTEWLPFVTGIVFGELVCYFLLFIGLSTDGSLSKVIMYLFFVVPTNLSLFVYILLFGLFGGLIGSYVNKKIKQNKNE
jgi:uncharacterized membrane protein YsdA (DUF1294 family)